MVGVFGSIFTGLTPVLAGGVFLVHPQKLKFVPKTFTPVRDLPKTTDYGPKGMDATYIPFTRPHGFQPWDEITCALIRTGRQCYHG